MQLKSNSLLKILVPVLLLGAGFAGLKSCHSSDHPGRHKQTSNTIADLSDDELRALGIDGDTPRDTVATLVGQMKQYRQEMETIRTSSAELVRENQRLRDRDNHFESRINSAINRERDTFNKKLQQQQTSLLDSFQQKLNQLGQKLPEQGNDIPPSLGLDQTDIPATAMRWVEPSDTLPADKRAQALSSGVPFSSSFGNAGDNAISRQKKALLEAAKGERNIGEATPVYTLPQNSTLTGSVAMTALLGRVPVNGTVNDPYPFKVLIGRDNLTANGTLLPDVEGAILSGTASGDWTLSCVRGTVHSVTFVFRDGTIRTVPEAANKADSHSSKPQDSEIGWISDPHGLPCIPGERKSNSAEYLSSQFLLAGSSAAAQAFANGQTTTSVEGGAVTSALTGNSGQYVLGQALGGGLKDSADWFKQRYGQTFDAIYVPPGHPVAIHLTRQIPVDYEPQGRKVKYAQTPGSKRKLD
ncbi:TIGR03752 family integrating conjugative element protein [Salmonella enterica]|nr:TIGR03752 family integrating conjugative element protein [Salmonella enterica]EGJ1181924.1 TIGR03752 family integrating conjugative element protein [Salmonella enterica]EIP2883699.1 TIGR03752 family integrating conjugative element protein [Salmonella enterica]EJL0293675.1 TIGR03752 family integrating conjugative element protein [Salmonella enterica]EJZ3418280.1 TIGR03752 family integrating conjugative element protein [Salmonella enterica]